MAEQGGPKATWRLVSYHLSFGCGGKCSEAVVPTAAVMLEQEGTGPRQDAAVGKWPLDALFRCVQRIVGVEVSLKEVSGCSLSIGTAAEAKASVVVVYDGREFSGEASGQDSVKAILEAFLAAINMVLQEGRAVAV